MDAVNNIIFQRCRRELISPSTWIFGRSCAVTAGPIVKNSKSCLPTAKSVVESQEKKGPSWEPSSLDVKSAVDLVLSSESCFLSVEKNCAISVRGLLAPEGSFSCCGGDSKGAERK